MASHRAPSIAGLIRRQGTPVSVRRKAGQYNPVTARHDSAVEIQVDTTGVLLKSDQTSMQGDPLSTENAYYLVLAAPFANAFKPKDADLVIDARGLEARVLSVKAKILGGKLLAYQLFVSGVTA